ncbi:hypothetical protein OFL61_31375 [Pseudomonas aeruginosa]|nr:hypothetical protein [Pseudomonas aeruginosa]MCV6276796.1 hypothetical protein [Pseudomonas aeruginosa]
MNSLSFEYAYDLHFLAAYTAVNRVGSHRCFPLLFLAAYTAVNMK